MAKKNNSDGEEAVNEAALIPNDDHPDFVAGTYGDDVEGYYDALTPVPDGPLPGPFPGPLPFPQPLPQPFPFPQPLPKPIPQPFPFPGPRPIRFCGPVSGRYKLPDLVLQQPPLLPVGPRLPSPILPINNISMIVRVDVDRFFPQRRISIEVTRRIPRATAHIIAEVTSDQCLGINRRKIEADITFRDGTPSLIPGTKVTFEAGHTSGINYNSWKVTLSGGGITPVVYNLAFESQYFDIVEFEVDRVANAGTPVTTHATASHPTRPPGLASETISLQTVYQRAGFDVSMSPNASVIPISAGGTNVTWSDTEMHNAMITYWSRFADRPQWAMWVLYAARHDTGRNLGGIMFDDIGPNHRQGTAIFTDSFIQDAPAGDANPAAWRNRMVFWTAVHEMGHAFNLAHSWQKSLGTPWIPLANEPEARSFMNYPFNVAGGQAAFFANFGFRFSDNELIFMRHAPRRFVQMGNSSWFVNHGFEAPDPRDQSGHWKLQIRPNRTVNSYAFMEPVKLELKLTNSSDMATVVDADMLTDGRHVSIMVGREGAETKQWRPFITACHKTHTDDLKPGASLYGAHLIGASTNGWLIDEPGFYNVQAAVDVGGEIVVSNVLRLFVAPPVVAAESKLAPDYFTEDVGRVIAFEGAPALETATDTLREVAAQLPNSAAARHAEVALSAPLLTDFKRLDASGDRADMAIATTKAKVSEGVAAQSKALLDKPDAAAETMGHIDYFGALERLFEAMKDSGDSKGAHKVLQSSVSTMKKRGVLPSVIAATQRKLDK